VAAIAMSLIFVAEILKLVTAGQNRRSKS